MLSLLCKDLCVFIVALHGKAETVFTSSLCCKFLCDIVTLWSEVCFLVLFECSQMLSLEPELSISGDEKAQMRHELLAEMAQERQQQEEKALCIQRSWARGVSRSNERDQDMER